MRRILVSIVAAALAACTPLPFMGAPLTDRDILLAPEIVRARVLDAYQAVRQLRPQFLQVRASNGGRVASTGIRVYLDETEMGGVDELRSIPIERVTAIRYIEPSDARFRWGGRHAAGIIQVSTSRELAP